MSDWSERGVLVNGERDEAQLKKEAEPTSQSQEWGRHTGPKVDVTAGSGEGSGDRRGEIRGRRKGKKRIKPDRPGKPLGGGQI